MLIYIKELLLLTLVLEKQEIEYLTGSGELSSWITLQMLHKPFQIGLANTTAKKTFRKYYP